jgi:hypothetical protein
MKVDSIPPAEQATFAHFSLLGMQFLTHHHWIEETIGCMSPLAWGILLVVPNHESVPALEPEFTCPAIQEHATFADAMHNLEHYFEDVCGFKKDEKGHAVPAAGKQKAAFDAAKIKYMIEELCVPMFIHVSAPPKAREPSYPYNFRVSRPGQRFSAQGRNWLPRSGKSARYRSSS